MSARSRIRLAVDGRIVVARGWRAAELIKESGAKATYSGSAGGWMFDRRRLGDLLAYLETRGIAVVVEDEAQPSLLDPAPDGGDVA